MRKLLIALPLLAACPAGDRPDPAPPETATDPSDRSDPPPPQPAADPSGGTDPAPAPDAAGSSSAAVALLGEPWSNRDEAGPRPDGRVDTFTFWGWDPSGTRFAFETFYGGAGAVQCEGAIEIAVVDATADRFAPDGRVEIRPKEPEPLDGRCDPVDLAAEAARRRDALLGRHGIEPGRLLPPHVLRGATPGFTAAGTPYRLAFASQSVTRDAAMAGSGASYTLAWTAPLAAVLEPGTRRRPPVYRYDLEPGLAFVSPTGGHVALVVRKVMVDFEGDRIGFMTNGAPLPR